MYGKGEQKMANRIMLNQTSYHGAGAIAEIVNEAKAHDYKKAFVCSDPDLIKFQVSTKVTDLLDQAGLSYEIYSNIKANPTIENVQTGDGVGILLQISHKFFSKAAKSLGINIGGEREYGVGMFFFPQDELKRNQAKKMFENIIAKEGMEFLAWREVPIAPDILGKRAVECMPYIMQCFVKKPKKVEKGLDFDRRLYVARRVFEQI
jgi:hypothetical protein